jgi:hypothetical protein
MAHVLAIRSETVSFFRLGFRSNPALIAAVGLTIGLQLNALYVPTAAAALHTQPLRCESSPPAPVWRRWFSSESRSRRQSGAACRVDSSHSTRELVELHHRGDAPLF